jgi:hypothetical protein
MKPKLEDYLGYETPVNDIVAKLREGRITKETALLDLADREREFRLPENSVRVEYSETDYTDPDTGFTLPKGSRLEYHGNEGQQEFRRLLGQDGGHPEVWLSLFLYKIPAFFEEKRKFIEEWDGGETSTPSRQKDPIKNAIEWLKGQGLIVKFTKPEEPVLENGAMTFWKPPVSEWRLTKSTPKVLKALTEAVESGIVESPDITLFMKTYLKQKNGNALDDTLKKA